MSRFTRITLAVLVSLGVIVAVFTSVEGASFSAQQEKVGSHLVSGPKVNLDHFRVADPAPMQSEFQSDKGHGCESDSQTSPDD